MFEHCVLGGWGIFGPKRDEVTGRWKEDLNEELCNFQLFSTYN
jgi:hypothetical protein